MTPEKNKLKEHLNIERKIIHLMLKSVQVVDEIISSGFTIDHFDGNHRNIVQCIFDEHYRSEQKRLLTIPAYRQHLSQKNSSNLMLELELFHKIQVGTFADTNELSYLKESLTESYIARQTQVYLKEFGNDCKKSYKLAVQNISEKLNSVLGNMEEKKIIYSSISELKDSWLQQLRFKHDNPDSIVKCGIPEIDESTNIGFQPQGLTLFVADTGTHKTNIMLNIAMNIAKRGHKILFVPLEMDYHVLMNRIVSNLMGINANKLAKPELLSNEDFKGIEESEIWLSNHKNLYILDAQERLRVSVLKREIEKRASVLRPQVIVVDYVDNLDSDGFHKERHNEIGDILKSLRFLGKKYGFHTISAAQMNRSAIKALREGKEDSVDSTAAHGSHQYSADSDTIFALTKVKDDFERIKIHTIKARHGKSGHVKELRVEPEYYRISSTDGTIMLKEDPADLESILNEPVEMIQNNVVEFSGGIDNL